MQNYGPHLDNVTSKTMSGSKIKVKGHIEGQSYLAEKFLDMLSVPVYHVKKIMSISKVKSLKVRYFHESFVQCKFYCSLFS